jgi:predicted nuclease of predicted toxin-antitoxin system
MNIVADESVDFTIVQFLREQGLNIYAIAEQQPSIADEDVLALAVRQEALLITEDKDFGALVFRLQLPHRGVILLRLSGRAPEEKADLAGRAILIHLMELQNAFSVFDGEKLRVRKLA